MKKLAILFMLTSSVSIAQISESEKKDYLDYLDTQTREDVHNSVHVHLDDSIEFWRIYGRYAEEKNAITSQFIDLIDIYTREFEILTEPQEYQMIHKAIEMRKEELRVREKYFELISSKINISAAAAFYQNETYHHTKSRTEILEKIPFIGQ